jgi:hypothetical protein
MLLTQSRLGRDRGSVFGGFLQKIGMASKEVLLGKFAKLQAESKQR